MTAGAKIAGNMSKNGRIVTVTVWLYQFYM